MGDDHLLVADALARNLEIMLHVESLAVQALDDHVRYNRAYSVVAATGDPTVLLSLYRTLKSLASDPQARLELVHPAIENAIENANYIHGLMQLYAKTGASPRELKVVDGLARDILSRFKDAGYDVQLQFDLEQKP